MGAQMVYMREPVTAKEFEDGGDAAAGTGFGVCAMQGWRRNMEDAHLAVTELDEKISLFGVFDGHGGRGVSRFAAKRLPEILRSTEAYQQGDYVKALERSFLAVDEHLRGEEGRRAVEELDKPDPGAPPQRVAVPRRVLQRFLDGDGIEDEDDDDDDEEEARLPAEEDDRPDAPADVAEPDPAQADPAPAESTAADPAPADLAAAEATSADPSSAESAPVESSGAEVAASGPTEEPAGAAGEAAAAGEPVAAEGAAAAVEVGKLEGTAPFCTSSTNGSTLPEVATKAGDGPNEEDEGEDSDEDYGEVTTIAAEDEGEDWGDEEMALVDPSRIIRDPTPEAQGCTAVVVLIVRRDTGEGPRIYCANAGDSRAVMSRQGLVVPLSEDHKPDGPIEVARIEKAGGFVQQMPGGARVQGDLNLSRAMGDLRYKKPDHLPPEEQILTAFPEVRTFELKAEDEFMVIGCDGIWERTGNQEIVDFIRPKLRSWASCDDPAKKQLSSICGEICDQGLCPSMDPGNEHFDGTGCDNMTVMIVQLKKDLEGEARKRPAEEPAAAHEGGGGQEGEEAAAGKRPRLETDASS